MYYAFIHKTLLSPFIRHTVEEMISSDNQKPCNMGFYCFVSENQNTDSIIKTPFYGSVLLRSDLVVEINGDVLTKHKYRYDMDDKLDLSRSATPTINFDVLTDTIKKQNGGMMAAKLFSWHPSQVDMEKELCGYGFDDYSQAAKALQKSLLVIDKHF